MRPLLPAALLFIACGPPPPPDAPAVLSYKLSAVADVLTAPVASSVHVTAQVQALTTMGLSSAPEFTAGKLVNFVVTSGGGAVFAGAAFTGEDGTAKEVWTLGTGAGNQSLEARTVDQHTGEPVVDARVMALATPGAAYSYHAKWTNPPVPGEAKVFAAGTPWVPADEITLWAEDQFANHLAQVDQSLMSFQSVSPEPASPDCPDASASGISCPLGAYDAIMVTPAQGGGAEHFQFRVE